MSNHYFLLLDVKIVSLIDRDTGYKLTTARGDITGSDEILSLARVTRGISVARSGEIRSELIRFSSFELA